MKRALVVLGRLPRPGRVKTRLHPVLGVEGATRLYAAMLHDVLAGAGEAAALAGAEVCFACDPLDRPLLEAHAFGVGFRLFAQSEGDLGERLVAAATQAHAEQVVLLGSDAPHLSPARIARLYDQIPPGGAALIPALDGGYVALGMQGVLHPLFHQIPWSTAGVLTTTQLRAEGSGLPLEVVGPAERDLDEGADLEPVYAALTEGSRTRSILAQALLAVGTRGV